MYCGMVKLIDPLEFVVVSSFNALTYSISRYSDPTPPRTNFGYSVVDGRDGEVNAKEEEDDSTSGERRPLYKFPTRRTIYQCNRHYYPALRSSTSATSTFSTECNHFIHRQSIIIMHPYYARPSWNGTVYPRAAVS